MACNCGGSKRKSPHDIRDAQAAADAAKAGQGNGVPTPAAPNGVGR